MKTTIILDDLLYRKLVQESIERFGTAKHLSETINDLLKTRFMPKQSLFGTLKRVSLKDIREKHDRYP